MAPPLDTTPPLDPLPVFSRSAHVQPSHVTQPPAFPAVLPPAFAAGESSDVSAQWDPSVHLQMEVPEYVVDLNFKKVPTASLSEGSASDAFPGLAFTAPFRLLSPQGVKALRNIISSQGLNPLVAQSDSRTPLFLRGLAFLSPFVRDFNRCPLVAAAFSEWAHDPVCAHSMIMNYSQMNVGALGLDRPVDAWHVDSVDYVAVIILSDSAEMEGGELQVVLEPKEEALAVMERQGGVMRKEQVMTVQYPGAGYAIFMQGSMMLHSVTPVIKGREPRITCVNSYMSRNVKKEDATHLYTFLEGDPEHISLVDYARHKCWRVGGLMGYVLDEAPYKRSLAEVTDTLTQAIEELQQCKDLITRTKTDYVGYFDPVTKKVVHNRIRKRYRMDTKEDLAKVSMTV